MLYIKQPCLRDYMYEDKNAIYMEKINYTHSHIHGKYDEKKRFITRYNINEEVVVISTDM